MDARTARQAAAGILRDVAPQQRQNGREAVCESYARPELGQHDAAHAYPRTQLERLTGVVCVGCRLYGVLCLAL